MLPRGAYCTFDWAELVLVSMLHAILLSLPFLSHAPKSLIEVVLHPCVNGHTFCEICGSGAVVKELRIADSKVSILRC